MCGIRRLFQIAALGTLILFSQQSHAEDVDDLLKQRRGFTEQRDELVRDFFRSVEVADNSRTSAVKNYLEAAQSAQTMIEILIQPNILKRLKPSTYAKILLSGVKTGIELGNAVNDERFARAVEESALETAKLALRYTERIHEIDMQISNLYTEQAYAQATLMGQAEGEVDLPLAATDGAGDGKVLDYSFIAPYPETFFDPVEIPCPDDWEPPGPGMLPSDRCFVGRFDQEVPSSTSADALEDLKNAPLGMEDELALSVVSFCEDNPMAVQCLPASRTMRFGAFCEGPNPLPDCNEGGTSSRNPGTRLGAFCEGPDAEADCIE